MSLNYPANDFRPASETLDRNVTASAAMFSDVLRAARQDAPMRHVLEVARIKHLITCCAWTDAALALLALELPQWQLRRLAYDQGEWHCALSENREMPDWLDAAVETHHPDMALAILGALLQARRERVASGRSEIEMGPPAPDALWQPALTDNFA